MQIKDVFEFYQEYIKPIYAEIEAKRNQIPVELLFETYASSEQLVVITKKKNYSLLTTHYPLLTQLKLKSGAPANQCENSSGQMIWQMLVYF